MKITRTSKYSGVERTIDIDVTTEEIMRWEGGEHIQSAMPHLTPAERKFIMTGVTEEEWDEMFPESEDY